MKNQKYYFPKLSEELINRGWSRKEFKKFAHKVNKRPSPRGWSMLMKKNHGMTASYSSIAKNTLLELGFDEEVAKFKPVEKMVNPEPLKIIFDPNDLMDKRIAEFIDIMSNHLGFELDIIKATPLPPIPIKKKRAA